MLRSALYLIAIAAMASPAGFRPSEAQVTQRIALSAGRAFMLDVDDPDPSGSYSVTGTFERRRTGTAFSLGVEAGLHEYLILTQDLSLDQQGRGVNLWWIRRMRRLRAGPASILVWDSSSSRARFRSG